MTFIQTVQEARDAIASLPEDAFGYAQSFVALGHGEVGETEPWPIRDEMLSNLDKALASAPFEWRIEEVSYSGEQSKLYLFGQAFVGWVSEGFEDGFDAHFVVASLLGTADGLVLGNRRTRAEAKDLCEQHVRKVFQLAQS